MGWVLRLVESGTDGSSGSVDALEIDRPGDLSDLAALGLRHAEGKQLLAGVQQAVVAAQSRDHAARRPACRTCGSARHVKITDPAGSPPCPARSRSGFPALRAHTLKPGEDLVDTAAAKPAAEAAAITLSVDSTYIRSCEEGSRHLEVRLGNPAGSLPSETLEQERAK